MIRFIEEKDKRDYFEMSEDFYSSGAALTTITDQMREDFWKEILDGVFVKGYIIECDGKTAGYALTPVYASQEFGGKVLWIDELYIKPEFRGRGLGSAFLKFAEENAVGYKLLRLEVEPDNKKANKLYKSLGFENLKYLQMIKKLK